MVSLLNSQAMKSCKSRESFCLSILSIYTNDWSFFWLVLNMCKPRTGWPTSIGILWLASIRSEIFLQMKFISFQGCPIKQTVFFTGIALSIISALSSHFFLFQNDTLHKILKLGFWLLSTFFSECSFRWMQHFCL